MSESSGARGMMLAMGLAEAASTVSGMCEVVDPGLARLPVHPITCKAASMRSSAQTRGASCWPRTLRRRR